MIYVIQTLVHLFPINYTIYSLSIDV